MIHLVVSGSEARTNGGDFKEQWPSELSRHQDSASEVVERL
jgi:hypothetical protein